MKSMRTRPGTVPQSPRVPGYLRENRSARELMQLSTSLREGAMHTPLFEVSEDPSQVYAHFLLVEDEQANPITSAILSANALVDHRDLAASEFEPLPQGLWGLTVCVPADWRASYRITTHRGTDLSPWRAASERRPIRLAADSGGIDHFNPRVGASMNGAPVSLAYGPAASVPEILATAMPDRQRPGPAVGGWGTPEHRTRSLHPRLHHHELYDENCRRPRDVWVYEPYRYSEPTPLVIVHDGATYTRFLAIADSLDAAISVGDLAPIHVLFIDSTNVELRGRELPFLEGTTTSITTQFLPWVRSLYRVSRRPEETLINGASFGGLAALMLVSKHPDLVGCALAQSPSLWHTPMTDALRSLPCTSRVLMQAGCYETDIHQGCLELMTELANTSSPGDIRFESMAGGHDWAWWHPELLRILAHIFPGTAPHQS